MQTISTTTVRNLCIAFAMLFVLAMPMAYALNAQAADFDLGGFDYFGGDYAYDSYDYFGGDYAYDSYDYYGGDYAYDNYDYYGGDYAYDEYDYYGGDYAYDYNYQQPSYSSPSYSSPSYSSPGYSSPSYNYPSYNYPSYNYPTYNYPSYPPQQPPVVCPPGTVKQGNTCVPPTQCPAGTVLQNGTCVPPVQCPSGYTLQNGQCVPPQGNCPSGYSLVNGQCIPPVQCPAGYTLSGNTCVPPITQTTPATTNNNNNNTNNNTNTNTINIQGYTQPTYQPVVYQQPIYQQQYCQSGMSGVYPNCYWPTQYDICPNINGIQSTLPAGYYIQNGNCYQSYTTPVYNNPNNPFVTLSAVPYTGLAMGPVGVALYWTFLILWCMLAAYLLVVKKAHHKVAAVVGSMLGFKQKEVRVTHDAPAHKVVAQKAEVKDGFEGIDPFIASQIRRA